MNRKNSNNISKYLKNLKIKTNGFSVDHNHNALHPQSFHPPQNNFSKNQIKNKKPLVKAKNTHKTNKKDPNSVIDIKKLVSSEKKIYSKKFLLDIARDKATNNAQKTLTYAINFRYLSHILPWKKHLKPTKNIFKDITWHEINPNGVSFEDLIDSIEKKLTPNIIPTQNPYFMGHMTTHIPSAVHEADILISYFNQNMVKKETSGECIAIERYITGWFHQLIYNYSDRFYQEINHQYDKTLGQIVSGGTMANLTALTVALNHRLPQCRTLGLADALKIAGYQRAVVICSERAHYSIAKTCAILGIGEQNLITIDVDPYHHTINIEKLNNQVLQLKKDQDTLIIAIIGVAGSTETGSIDDLNSIADICKIHNIWFHIDAAWIGAYFISDQLKKLLAGSEYADSITIDGHKLIGLTMGGGMVFFKDPDSPSVIEQSSQYILRKDSKDSGRFHLEGSRPFFALKLWILCKRQGKQGLSSLIEQSHQRTEIFQKVLNNIGDFRQTTALHCNIITYRWFPKALGDFLIKHHQSELGKEIEQALCKTHDHIHALGQQRKINGFVSKTRITIKVEGMYQKKCTVLRGIPALITTTAWHIKSLLQDQKDHASMFFTQQLKNIEKQYITDASSIELVLEDQRCKQQFIANSQLRSLNYDIINDFNVLIQSIDN